MCSKATSPSPNAVSSQRGQASKESREIDAGRFQPCVVDRYYFYSAAQLCIRKLAATGRVKIGVTVIE